MRRRNSEPNVFQLKEKLKRLKKQIALAKQKALFAPYLKMILEAKKCGKLYQLEEACGKVLYENDEIKSTPTGFFDRPKGK